MANTAGRPGFAALSRAISLALALSLTSLLALAPPGAMAATVAPGAAIRIYQQDFVAATSTFRSTTTGIFQVDLVRLRKQSGLAAGYVNVMTSKGWVVRNLPVLAESVYPYSRLSADFDLGVASGTALTALNAVVDYSPTATANFTGGSMASHTVSPMAIRIGGANKVAVGGPPPPPDHTAFPYTSTTQATNIIVQFDHSNVEAAVNQCFPASVANSLQFLKNRYGLPVPHENKPGLRPSVSPGDNSLVGQLDEAMNRTVVDRLNGDGVEDGLKGKLNYIAKNKLKSQLQVTHMGSLNGNEGAANVSSEAIDGVTASSTGLGSTINLDTLYKALQEQQNCELVYTWEGVDNEGKAFTGAHAVDLVGGIQTLGRNSLSWASDRNQRNDEEGSGPAGFEQSNVDGPDANGVYSLSGGNKRKAALVICEKYVPPPLTEKVTETIDPRGHLCCVASPPASVNLAVKGGEVTLSNATNLNVAWLPLKGTVSNGSFELASTASVAGFSNVTTRFAGTYANGVYSGTISVGNKGELFGVPISFRVQITESQRAAIAPAMRINGFRQNARAQVGEMIKPSISMLPGPFNGVNGDWFVVVGLADGRFLHLDLATMSWMDGVVPSYTGALFELPYFGLPEIDTLPAGTHSFYFGFDTVPNGQLDLNSAVYERTVLTVKP